MKKKFCYIFTILSFMLFLLVGCGEDKKNESNPKADTVSANRLNAEFSMNTVQNQNDNTNITNSVQEIRIAEHEVDKKEEELASFSTKLNGKDSPRSRNIGITTSILNETTIANGEVFSFCKIVGDPTPDRGYEKADAFDKDGKTIQSYGGGNCQVSSTLYNAVLAVGDLKVKERHAHIKPVHYVAKDKDATVAYGSVDFKFQNNTGSTIKIYATSDLSNVNIQIVKIQ